MVQTNIGVSHSFCHDLPVYKFIAEFVRWKKGNFGNKARPCYSEKHFSECDCNTCKKQVSESVKASLKMAHVRSIKTFVEAVPQWFLQVYIMVHEQSYPWYAIVSVAISFLSLVFSI
jgi:hypothetical protein